MLELSQIRIDRVFFDYKLISKCLVADQSQIEAKFINSSMKSYSL